MVTMLVVDDEIYALKGITQGIEWGDLPIARILEADSVPEARRQLEANQVDLVISDIEMPGASGMELLRFIKEACPATLTIFLTGHARFEYAQEAMRHGCFEYVLKPVDHDALKEIVRRAVAEIEERRAQQAFEETLETYRRQWTNQLPILVERFWQEALAAGLPASPDRLSREYATYDIPLSAGDPVLPVLLSVEQWDVGLDGRDERIMEYALRKAAAEIIVGAEGAGAALQDRAQQSLVLLYKANEARGEVLQRCSEYIRACREYFHCTVSCYVGEPAAPQALAAELERLSRVERANVAQPASVIDASNGAGHAGSAAAAVMAVSGQTLPPFMEWSILLDGGSVAELEAAISDALRRMKEEGAGRESLELFYYGYVHMLYQSALRRGVPAGELLSQQELAEGLAARTPDGMTAWALRLLAKTNAALLDRQRDASAVIAKIQSYVQEHLSEELGREEIARAVYRNPAYLSRLFRKETGMSLTDYIAQAKIERAKRLLTETNDKISNIAEGLGYLHFSYFAKLFRKIAGVTPQDYRKKHQSM
ncbi:response regulator transcription factor [Cohnella hashimotonis]|uniref:Response regulator n=1 Tax=Cohnella hashimotonis TaxID=2826895 RepID=A0ABT6TMM2_9BACL|nr:helix-turn-helix domain-containing protein [Cohnella hashimotonis]MDI4648107.1 response regulator [Cohnella hashimotonis]